MDDLPDDLAAPAVRGLRAAGITTLGHVTRWTSHELAALHGVGDTAICALRRALAVDGRGFRAPGPEDEGAQAVTAHLAGIEGPHRRTLDGLRATLRRVLPRADEGLAYGLPARLLDGAAVAGYGAAADHCTYAPMSGEVLERLGEVPDGYERSKGVLRIPPGHTVPVGLVRRLVAARLAELGEVSEGIRREYHRDGTVKAEGRMRGGELHGPWAWYRADGSLLRTGEFVDGEKSGEWRTWPATPS